MPGHGRSLFGYRDGLLKTDVQVNGQAVEAESGHYIGIRRSWKAGDVVTVSLDMKPRLTTANPLLREDRGRVAVERGPLVYPSSRAISPGCGSSMPH